MQKKNWFFFCIAEPPPNFSKVVQGERGLKEKLIFQKAFRLCPCQTPAEDSVSKWDCICYGKAFYWTLLNTNVGERIDVFGHVLLLSPKVGKNPWASTRTSSRNRFSLRKVMNWNGWGNWKLHSRFRDVSPGCLGMWRARLHNSPTCSHNSLICFSYSPSCTK